MKAIVTISGYGDKTIRTMSFIEHIKKLSEKDCPKVVFLPTAGFDNFTPETEAYQDFVDAGCDVYVLKLSEYKKGSKKGFGYCHESEKRRDLCHGKCARI